MTNLKICSRCAAALRQRPVGSARPLPGTRWMHTTACRPANPLPVTGAGPPPEAPRPAASTASERVARKRRQADLLKQAKEIRSGGQQGGQQGQQGQASSTTTSAGGTTSPLRRRFWKDVSVRTQADGSHTVHLDERPVRAPATRAALPIPASKPHLATAIALEWDGLTSAQQALKTHMIPLTSMASRALDLQAQDEGTRAPGSPDLGQSREEVVRMLLRYLDTDTLLCWAPERGPYDDGVGPASDGGSSSVNSKKQDEASSSSSSSTPTKEGLRQKQVRYARDIIAHLNATVWPGVTIRPALGPDSILPTPQPAETKAVIGGWIGALGPWELAGLERATLATKSLCVGARLLIDWAEAFQSDRMDKEVGANAAPRFGIEQAAEACSLEVAHQTALWGEVEDTHDVDREDLRRQLGSVVLLVSGTG